jgi:hypothetical protein
MPSHSKRKTAVARPQNPFALSLSKGEWILGLQLTGERRKVVHASTKLSTNGFSAF